MPCDRVQTCLNERVIQIKRCLTPKKVIHISESGYSPSNFDLRRVSRERQALFPCKGKMFCLKFGTNNHQHRTKSEKCDFKEPMYIKSLLNKKDSLYQPILKDLLEIIEV